MSTFVRMVVLLGAFALYHVDSAVIERRQVAECPAGARPMYLKNGTPRKCLPHQNNLCVDALTNDDSASTICCWYNQVDYFCCLDVSINTCPDYNNVTVIIQNAQPHQPLAMKSFHFRQGIEQDLLASGGRGIGAVSSGRSGVDDDIRSENGVLVRHGGRRR